MQHDGHEKSPKTELIRLRGILEHDAIALVYAVDEAQLLESDAHRLL